MQNYTDISDLVEELKNAPSPFLTYDTDSAVGLSGKEHEPQQKKEFLLNTDAELDANIEKSPESNPEMNNTDEWDEHSNEEINIEVKPDTIELDKELEDMGVESTGSSAFTPAHDLKLPVSDEVIYADRKKPISDAERWRSEFFTYLLHQVHTGLKKVRGKVVRVAKGKKNDILDMPETPDTGMY